MAAIRVVTTASANSSTGESPSSFRSVRSSRSATASKAWCTFQKCQRTTLTFPSKWSTPGEELWVKIIDLDLQRRRISLSIKQAAEGGVVAAEYQEHFGEHAYDDEGNYIGGAMEEGSYSEGQEAWEEYFAEGGEETAPADGDEAVAEGAPAEDAAVEEAPVAEAAAEEAPAEEAPAEDAPVAEAAAEEAPAEESAE